MPFRSLRGPCNSAPIASAGTANRDVFNHFAPVLCRCRRLRAKRLSTTVLLGLTNQRTRGGLAARPAHSLAAFATVYSSGTKTKEFADSYSIDARANAVAASVESLQTLEWPAICKQVACFCGTSVAAELVARGQLPRGHTRQGGEVLLQQTAEALEANLEVQGCFDIRPAVEAAAGGACLNAKQFEGVASTLEAAFALKARVSARESEAGFGPGPEAEPAPAAAAAASGPGRGSSAGRARDGPGPRFPSLEALAADIDDEERTLLRAIRGCIQLGSVSDAASEALAAVRAERQANKEALRAEVEGWARQLRAKGAAEPGAVTLVRGRFCVGVKAGRQGELPKGSVRLSASSTGATLYVEPKPAVELNNQEALLADRERAEEVRVLSLLSKLLGSRAQQLGALVAAFTALDVVAARARHARWLGGTRPAFVDVAEPGSGPSPLHVPGALHPVLMQRGLPPLPQAPSIDDNRFDRDFQAAPAWELRRVMRPEGPQSGERPPEAGVRAGEAGGSAEPAAASSLMPRPLDLRVPPGRAVVAITGPNTGGKTVTLKAAGLMVLMAQAGLYLPCHPDHLATHGPPRLAWFDRVLADIGDTQSLQQNLSTFSGHIRRIKQILAAAAAAGGRSLVLLDEVGSGTDPLEGAALARAVLDRLADQAFLTLATTHHAELKRAADEDPRYVNVSMAFDTASLRPTYTLCWGAAGASNALDIAETLGFDRAVVLEARNLARAMADSAEGQASTGPPASASPAGGAGGGRESRLAGVAASLIAQLEETRQELEAQGAVRERRREVLERVQETIEQVREMEALLKMSPREIVAERDELAAEVQSALDAFAAGLQPQAPVEEALGRIEALLPDQVAAFRRSGLLAGAADAGEEGALQPGDRVYVPSYGDFGNGRVVSVKGDEVRVVLDVNTQMPFAGGKPRGGKSVRLARKEVQKLGGGPEVQLGAHSGWSGRFPGLVQDIRRVLGDVSEEERAEAARVAERRAQLRSQRQEDLSAGFDSATYEDLLALPELAEESNAHTNDDEEALWDVMSALDDEYDIDGEDVDDLVRPRPAGSAADDGSSGGAGGGKAGGSSGRGSGGAVTRQGSGAGGGKKGQAAAAATAAAAAGAAAGAAQAAVLVPPLQTAANTLDVAGEVPELAAADLEDYLRDAAPGAAFYVRHGVGTGAVRSAVLNVLRRQGAPEGRVREWREAPNSRGGVTVVFLQ